MSENYRHKNTNDENASGHGPESGERQTVNFPHSSENTEESSDKGTFGGRTTGETGEGICTISLEGKTINVEEMTDAELEKFFRNHITKNKKRLRENKRPDENSKNYIIELLIYKDKNYRESNGLSRIHTNDCKEYSSILIDSVQNKAEKEITNGRRCGKCGKNSAVLASDQRRSGDEGASLVLKCTISRCGFVKLISH
jgi:DNA-directed RNA polymerase subunit M/transcription elongation factor TFIIS